MRVLPPKSVAHIPQAARVASLRCANRGRRGQVLLIALVSLTLLVGIVFYVLNVGDQVNRRLDLQNSADAVAAGGAGWMARSMNVIAMNNVGQARMISLVPVFDALPLASEMCHKEAVALAGGLDDRLDRVNVPGFVKEGIELLHKRLEGQAWILERMTDTFTDEFVRDYTWWADENNADGVRPSGLLWRAAVAMRDINTATLESCDSLSQLRAEELARANGVQKALLLPMSPKEGDYAIPAKFGDFLDFGPLLRNSVGIVEERSREYVAPDIVRNSPPPPNPHPYRGGGIPDYADYYRLGPFARLYKWREPAPGSWNVNDPGVVVSGVISGPGGTLSGGESAIQVSGNTYTQRDTGYRTKGPYWRLVLRILLWANDHRTVENGVLMITPENRGALAYTSFYERFKRIADIKLNYIFTPPLPGGGVSRTKGEVHYPEWIIDYGDAKTRASTSPDDVKHTRYYIIEIASRYPESNRELWSADGVSHNNATYPMVLTFNRWADGNSWGYSNLGKAVWKQVRQYRTSEYLQLGLQPAVDANGHTVMYTIYVTSWYIFAGIDVGKDVEVKDPANWDSDELANLPAPIMLDTSYGDYNFAAPSPNNRYRKDWFSRLSVVTDHNKAAFWSQKFHATELGSGENLATVPMVSLAQAKIFNNKSWDLWTQDWQVQLMPVDSNWDSWIGRMEDDMDIATDYGMSVDERFLVDMTDYMRALSGDLTEEFVNH